MARLRFLLVSRPWLALALVLAALAVRVAVPAGMMPGAGRGGPTLVVCSGRMAAPSTGHRDAQAPDVPCAFTGLIAAALDTPALPVVPAPAPLPVAQPVAVPAAVAVPALRLWPPRTGPPAFA